LENIMKRLLTVAAVAAIGLVAAPAATAQDSFTFGDADVLGPVHVRGDVARVHARYSCEVGTHIWVSAKQSAARDIDPAVAAEGAGFGGVATAWWQSHAGSFTCDDKRHVAWFTVDTSEPGSRGQLGKGWAWVQFCVTTDEGLSAVRMEWSRVVVNRRHT
jgi:opacity protein-like surface antigen